MNKSNRFIDKMLVILGSAIVAFGIYNIHSKCKIAEGGNLGIELLIYNWLNISPAIASVIINLISYIIGSRVLGNKFFLNAIIGTISYSFFYFIFENTPSIFPDLSNHLLLASIIGALFVGVGTGIVVRNGGACGGDDAIALTASKIFKLPVSIAYILLDVFVIVISLSYLDSNKIVYSLLTATISSILIGYISKMDITNKAKTI